MDEIHVLFATDAIFLPPTSVAIYSMLRHRPADAFTNIHVVTKGISKTTLLDTLSFQTSSNYQIIHYSSEDLGLKVGPQKSKFITSPTYFRLSLEGFLDINRVVYLDGDIICLADVGPLFRTNLGDATIGAVRDIFAVRTGLIINGTLEPPRFLDLPYWQDMHDNLLRVADGRPLRDLFNAGILLIDVKKFRELGIAVQARQLMNDENFLLADQDALNLAAKNHIHYLSSIWNSSRGNGELTPGWPEFDRAYFDHGQIEPKIIHFVGPSKPWKNRPSRYKEKEFKYNVAYAQCLRDSKVHFPNARPVTQSEVSLFNFFSRNFTQFHSVAPPISEQPSRILSAHPQTTSDADNKSDSVERYKTKMETYDDIFALEKENPATILLLNSTEHQIDFWLNYFKNARIHLCQPDGEYKRHSRLCIVSSQSKFDKDGIFTESRIAIDGGASKSSRQRQRYLKEYFPQIDPSGFYLLENICSDLPETNADNRRVSATGDLLAYLLTVKEPLDEEVFDLSFCRYLIEATATYASIPTFDKQTKRATHVGLLRKTPHPVDA